MNKEKLKAFAKDIVTGIKTEQVLNDFRHVLTKIKVEAVFKSRA